MSQHVSHVSVEELDDQVALRKARLSQVIKDIRAVFVADIAVFVPREVKKAFLSQSAVAAGLDKAQIGSLKTGSVQAGKDASESVGAKLEDESLWLSTTATPTNPRDLVEAAPVWAVIDEANSALAGILEGLGFTVSEEATYKSPAFFVNGLYLPSLCEHYWRLLEEISHLERSKVELVETATRSHLESLWDDA